MSAENKKLMGIAVALCVLVLVISVAGVLFFVPKKGATMAPATVANNAAPKAADPQDFLSLPPQSMPTEQAPNKDGDIIVIYGDKPASISPGLGAGIPPTTVDDAAVLQAAANSAAGGGTAAAAAAAAAKPAVASAKSGGSPAKTAVAKPTAAKAAAARPVDEYWIQAASFSSRGKADDLKDTIAKKGLSSIITVKDINGKSWYRVRIGPYASTAEATGWLTKIKTVAGCEEAGIWKGATEKK